jgi:penicillin amidase
MIPDAYPYKIGFEWASPYRFRRISDVLSQARNRGWRLGVQDMEQLQTDVLSLPALELKALLRTASATHPSAAAKMLLQWDGRLMRDSSAAALYELWLRELRAAVFDRAVPRNGREILREWSTSLVLAQLSKPSIEVFGENPAQGRDRLLLETLERATSELAKLQGGASEKWTWGRLHTVRFRHPLDRIDADAEALFDSGPLPRPGDEDTVNATGFPESFEQVSGASYREILDTSDWDQSRVVNTPGQSGQPLSPNYSDLLGLWDDGQYLPLLYSERAVQHEAAWTLVLEPQSQR